MIPRLDSMTVHIDEPMLFHVVSRWEVAMSSVVIRRMEVMQVLRESGLALRGEVDGAKGTYKIPTANTPQRAILDRSGSCSLLTTGTGSAMITRSVRMLNAALANQNAVMLIQVPPRALSNAYRTGVHWNILETTVPMVKAEMIPIHVQHVIRNQRLMNRRM